MHKLESIHLFSTGVVRSELACLKCPFIIIISLLTMDDTTLYLFIYGQCVPRRFHFVYFAKWSTCHNLEWGRLKIGPMSLKFEVDRNFCTMHLPNQVHHPVFSSSEVIVLTNKHTNISTNKQKYSTFTSLRYARRWRNTLIIKLTKTER